MSHGQVGAVLLAAGESSRYGTPKQLATLPNGTTLLQNAVNSLTNSSLNHIVVVLGANASEISERTDLGRATSVVNHGWKTGMASSIQAGMRSLKINNVEANDSIPQIQAILLLVADQPGLTTKTVEEFLRIRVGLGGESTIVCASYGGTLGVPCLFESKHFPELFALSGEHGAKKLLGKHSEILTCVDFPAGLYDVDYPSDLPKSEI